MTVDCLTNLLSSCLVGKAKFRCASGVVFDNKFIATDRMDLSLAYTTSNRATHRGSNAIKNSSIGDRTTSRYMV